MGVTSTHPQIFMPQNLRYRVNVLPQHCEPACGSVAAIVEGKILNACSLTRSLKGDGNVSGLDGEKPLRCAP